MRAQIFLNFGNNSRYINRYSLSNSSCKIENATINFAKEAKLNYVHIRKLVNVTVSGYWIQNIHTYIPTCRYMYVSANYTNYNMLNNKKRLDVCPIFVKYDDICMSNTSSCYSLIHVRSTLKVRRFSRRLISLRLKPFQDLSPAFVVRSYHASSTTWPRLVNVLKRQ